MGVRDFCTEEPLQSQEPAIHMIWYSANQEENANNLKPSYKKNLPLLNKRK